jgi:hypothetical protein
LLPRQRSQRRWAGQRASLSPFFLAAMCQETKESQVTARSVLFTHIQMRAALLLIKHSLLIIGLRRSAGQSALIISTHTHSHWASDGGKHFFSIIDAEKLSRRRRRSARITKHAHCPCGYTLLFFLSLIFGCSAIMLTERGCANA